MINQRKEGLIRILVAIASGIIFYVWGWLILVLTVINLIFVLISGKKIKEFEGFCEEFSKEINTFIRYLIFTTDERPFPFKKIFKKVNK